MRTFEILAAGVLASAGAHVMQYEALPYDSVADPKAVVVSGLTRFTVLTPHLIRMEQSKQDCTCAAATPCKNLNDGSCDARSSTDPPYGPCTSAGQKDCVCTPGTSDCQVGHFEDRPTLAIVHRHVPVPAFTSALSADNATLTIATEGGVTLTYAVGKAFAPDTLSVAFPAYPAVANTVWKFGDANDGNLLGTIKSLDELGPISLNCTENAGTTVHGETLHCEWGVASRQGWSVYNDTANYCLGAGDWWATDDSTTTANANGQDLYGFFHGSDYKGAVKDLTLVGGRSAMVPRAASSGVWWTRWFDFTDGDAQGVAAQYRARSYPLDVFVLDMDWHRKNSWTGYSFDNSLFPDEQGFMAAMHEDYGLLLAANLHDDVGIGPWENKFDYMSTLMGWEDKTKPVPFTMCTNTTYTFGVEDEVLGSLEDGRIGGKAGEGGMDFWWIDWQQGGNHGGCAGLKQNPTIWTNKIRCTDAKRRAVGAALAAGASAAEAAAVDVGRNMVLARWGGMGSHRYQVGFSGDVKGLTWDNLAYQPYFTLTAANVGYGFWSHDIEQPASDYEMGARWVQWAAVSPIFRSHERGMSGGSCSDELQAGQARSTCAVVEPWNVPQQYAEANRAAMRRRVELTPYTYTAARQAYDSGVGLLRPMYYEHPAADGAYGATAAGAFSQFYFGEDMFAAPVVRQSAAGSAPMSFSSGVTTTSVWVPPGAWVEESTLLTHVGAATTGTVLKKAYDLSETPVFVRAGALVPSVPLVDGDTLGVAARQYTSIEFSLYPGGAASGSTRVYEDDGATTAYTRGAYAYLKAAYTRDAAARTLTFTTAMDGSEGTPADASVTPAQRATTLRIKAAPMPSSVTVNGATLPKRAQRASSAPPAVGAAAGAAAASWYYCPVEMAVVVRAPAQATSQTLTIVVTTGASMAAASLLDGAKGHVAHANLAKRSLDLTRKTVGAHDPAADHLKKLASAGSALSYAAARGNATAFAALAAALPQMVKDANAETAGMAPFKENPRRLAYALALLNAVTKA